MNAGDLSHATRLVIWWICAAGITAFCVVAVGVLFHELHSSRRRRYR